MLQGDRVRLRLVREADLGRLYDFHADIGNRGEFFPVGVVSLPTFQDQYRKSGFWERGEGLLIIAGDDDGILGHIEFFETVSYHRGRNHDVEVWSLLRAEQAGALPPSTSS